MREDFEDMLDRLEGERIDALPPERRARRCECDLRVEKQHEERDCRNYTYKQYLRLGRSLLYLCDECCMRLTDIMVRNNYDGWTTSNPAVLNMMKGLPEAGRRSDG